MRWLLLGCGLWSTEGKADAKRREGEGERARHPGEEGSSRWEGWQTQLPLPAEAAAVVGRGAWDVRLLVVQVGCGLRWPPVVRHSCETSLTWAHLPFVLARLLHLSFLFFSSVASQVSLSLSASLSLFFLFSLFLFPLDYGIAPNFSILN